MDSYNKLTLDDSIEVLEKLGCCRIETINEYPFERINSKRLSLGFHTSNGVYIIKKHIILDLRKISSVLTNIGVFQIIDVLNLPKIDVNTNAKSLFILAIFNVINRCIKVINVKDHKIFMSIVETGISGITVSKLKEKHMLGDNEINKSIRKLKKYNLIRIGQGKLYGYDEIVLDLKN